MVLPAHLSPDPLFTPRSAHPGDPLAHPRPRPRPQYSIGNILEFERGLIQNRQADSRPGTAGIGHARLGVHSMLAQAWESVFATEVGWLCTIADRALVLRLLVGKKNPARMPQPHPPPTLVPISKLLCELGIRALICRGRTLIRGACNGEAA
ncbi:hypothetical protein JHW43_001011 [Diplocarpon mali]|nr:hypothetical protein JHW43_001011 [Diplocarpon mali]